MPLGARAPGALSLKGRALRLLSGREHSRTELSRKLSTFEEEAGQLDTVLDELQARGFISEKRVADSVVHRREGRLGAARIRHELLGKGLAPSLVAESVHALQATELSRAREVWRKKFASVPTEAADRGKQQRFLLSRGFAADVIREVLRGGDSTGQ